MSNSTISKTVFVAFLDIMGFKELVKNNDSEDLGNIFNGIFDTANLLNTSLKDIATKLDTAVTSDIAVQLGLGVITGDPIEAFQNISNDIVGSIDGSILGKLQNMVQNKPSIIDGVTEGGNGNIEIPDLVRFVRDNPLLVSEQIGGELEELKNRAFKALRVNLLSISDSIVLWTEDDSVNSFISIVNYTSFLLSTCIMVGIPLRGAISKGPITVKNAEVGEIKQTNVFGKSLVDAYTLEGRQQWSGCIIGDECFEFTEVELLLIDEMFRANYITNYRVPQKSGKIREYKVVNWVTNLKDVDLESNGTFIRESFSKFNKSIDDWSVGVKIDNTVKFYLEMKMAFSSEVETV